MPAQSDKYRILAVCHDPKGDLVPRTKLNNLLKSSPGFCKYFDSVWLIATHETPTALWKRIEKSVPEQDYVLIIEAKSYYGSLPKDAWDWIASVKNPSETGETRG